MNAFELIPKLIRSAYQKDQRSMENLALMIGKGIKKQYPDIAAEITQIIANNRMGGNVYRSMELTPLPIDADSRDTLVKIDESLTDLPPILSKEAHEQIDNFLQERTLIDRFLNENITPPNSILLYGKPGVGKTYAAKWISYKLHLPMAVLDLASSVSSYLGRTGRNIKNIFDYTRKENIILFLDELDAIAKRRDDEKDLGELKRLVNILLKELDNCPVTCVIIGATNHPEMLDKAIWRRFDRCLEISEPQKAEREALFTRMLDKWHKKIDNTVKDFLINQTSGKSAADICKLCEHIKRQIIMHDNQQENIIAIRECCRSLPLTSKEQKINICKFLKDNFQRMSCREISEITMIPSASVNRYIR